MSRSVYNVVFATIALALLAPWVGVYYCGITCVEYVTSLNGKIFLVLTIDAVVVLICLQFYIYFVPASAIRQTRSIINLCKGGIVASFALPWGAYLAINTELYDTKVELNFAEASIGTTLALATCWIMLFFLNKEYSRLRQPENIGWAMLE